MNAAARARIGEAKKAWWAKQKRNSVAAKSKPTPISTAKRKPMSSAARKKLSELNESKVGRKEEGRLNSPELSWPAMWRGWEVTGQSSASRRAERVRILSRYRGVDPVQTADRIIAFHDKHSLASSAIT